MQDVCEAPVDHSNLTSDALAVKIALSMVLFAVVDDVLYILMNKACDGRYSLPRAWIQADKDKNLQSALLRYMQVSTGCRPLYVEQVKTVGYPERDEAFWRVDVMYLGLVNTIDAELNASFEWCDVSALLSPLSVSHKEAIAIRSTIKRLKNKARYTSILAHAMPEAFTLSDLQRAYEVVLDTRLEKKAFRRRWLQAAIIEPMAAVRDGVAHRPAQAVPGEVRSCVSFFC